MDTYKDGDIENEREAALFEDPSERMADWVEEETAPNDPGMEWQTELDLARAELDAEMYFARFDDDPDPYSGTYSEE